MSIQLKIEQAKKHLFQIQYVTIYQFIQNLEQEYPLRDQVHRKISSSLDSFGSKCICYFAAAVSDFYICPEKLSDHKIQSSLNKDGLMIHLQPVPKLLGKIKSTLCPKALCVSFKLQTDQSILKLKVKKALDNYGVDLVVANLLQTRRTNALIFGQGKFEMEPCIQLSQVSQLYVQKIFNRNKAQKHQNNQQQKQFAHSTISM